MADNWKEYKGSEGIQIKKGEDGENDILNLANLYCAYHVLGTDNETKEQLKQFLIETLDKFNYPNVVHWNDSHDNFTAVYCACALAGIPLPKSVEMRAKFHPRDIIFEGLVKGKLWSKILYPVLLLIMWVSCSTTEKIRPKLFSGIIWDGEGKKDSFMEGRWRIELYKLMKKATYKFGWCHRSHKDICVVHEDVYELKDRPHYPIRKIFKTDGQILNVLRIEALQELGHGMRFTRWLLDKALTKSISSEWREDLYGIFYADKDHPVSLAWMQANRRQ